MLDDAPDIRLEPAPERHPFRTIGSWLSPRLVLGVVLGLLAVEVGLRALELRTGDLGVLTSTTSTHAERLADVEHDVVVIGSSSAGADVWIPDLEQSGAVCDGYAAWIPTPTMQDLVDFTAEFVVTPNTPRDVVIAVTMREFVPPDEQPSEVDKLLTPTSWLERNVQIVRARPTLQDPFQFGLAIEQDLAEELNGDGNQLLMRDRSIATESAQHRDQERRRMAQFRLTSETVDAFTELISVVQRAGAGPIVVNLPVTDLFVEMAPRGRVDYDQYLAAVTAVATSTGAEFVDLGRLPLDVEAQFADVNHLNADGSRVLTEALGRELGGCRP